ncbi:MAG: RNA polymerase subunit sigma-70 [Planctomycetota bacterium]|nr:MAG: RNA polymerase subunit sigma-70 [Planctomycetota bacterium]
MSSHAAHLLSLARQGDATAFQMLLALYRSRLKRLIGFRMDRRLAGRFDLSDIVQDALVQAYLHWQRFASLPDRPFYAWLREIACNRLIDLHRRHVKAQRRSVAREQSLSGPPVSTAARRDLARRLVDSGLSPSRHAERREALDQVHAALAQLRDDDRDLLVMRFLEELSPEEIADVLHISYSAVTSRQVRALQRLSGLVAGPRSREKPS